MLAESRNEFTAHGEGSLFQIFECRGGCEQQSASALCASEPAGSNGCNVLSACIFRSFLLSLLLLILMMDLAIWILSVMLAALLGHTLLVVVDLIPIPNAFFLAF